MECPEGKPAGRAPVRALARVALPLVSAWLLAASLTPLFHARVPVLTDVPAEKLALFERGISSYTTIFLGASATNRDIVPRAFDEELGRAGCPQKSFNFADPGASISEVYLLMKSILESSTTNLKWAFLDETIMGDVDVIGTTRPGTSNFVSWHTWENTRAVSKILLEGPGELSRRYSLLAFHWAGFLQRALDPGPGAELARWGMRALRRRDPSGLVLGDDGNISLGSGAHRPDFESHAGIYTRLLANVGQPDPKNDLPYSRPYKTLMFRKLIALFRAHGIKTVLLVPPILAPYERVDRDSEIPVLAFNLPAQYPAFYSVDSRYDFDHLNPDAAVLFSRNLAGEFARKVGCPATRPE